MIQTALGKTLEGLTDGHGFKLQRERLAAVARWSCEHHPGDLAEIGCYTGGATVYLAAVAREHGRRLLCVDPWETGTQNCNGTEYEYFRKNTAEFADVIDVVRCNSTDQQAIVSLEERPLAFSFVDGLHVYKTCRSDIMAVQHTRGIIAIDDAVSNFAGCIRAAKESADELGKVRFFERSWRELYLI